MRIGAAKRALGDNRHCGDQYGYWATDDRTTLCIVDGTGHGGPAEAAALAALDHVAGHLSRPLEQIFAGCDARLRDTRGAAMAIARFERGARTLTYAGVNNTRAVLVGPSGSIRFAGNPGIVGGGYRKLSVKSVETGKDDVLILYTDGLSGRVCLSFDDPRLHGDPQVLAERILEEWGRPDDDAAVLLCQGCGT